MRHWQNKAQNDYVHRKKLHRKQTNSEQAAKQNTVSSQTLKLKCKLHESVCITCERTKARCRSVVHPVRPTLSRILFRLDDVRRPSFFWKCFVHWMRKRVTRPVAGHALVTQPGRWSLAGQLHSVRPAVQRERRLLCAPAAVRCLGVAAGVAPVT